MKDLIVFDMDGVLVEVTESYRASIQATVKHFTGNEPTPAEIQDWKNRGGYNDDWKLSHAMIQERGVQPAYDEVVHHFQKLFLGENNDGLILREKWIATDGLFKRLAVNNTLAVFTGRFRAEANLTLNRFLPRVFSPVIGVDDVTYPKPDAEGLIRIISTVEHRKAWYVGDTIDDADAAFRAGVPFIGIAGRGPARRELNRIFVEFGAVAVLDNINFLEKVIAQN